MSDVRKPQPKKKYPSAGKAVAKAFDKVAHYPPVSDRDKITIDKDYGGTHYGKNHRNTRIVRNFLGKKGMQGSTDASRAAKAAKLENRVQKQEFSRGGLARNKR
jgi:hypothetical protein